MLVIEMSQIIITISCAKCLILKQKTLVTAIVEETEVTENIVTAIVVETEAELYKMF